MVGLRWFKGVENLARQCACVIRFFCQPSVRGPTRIDPRVIDDVRPADLQQKDFDMIGDRRTDAPKRALIGDS